MRTLSDIITEQDFFKDLTQEQIHALANIARYRRVRANEMLFQGGNLANRFYVLVSGKVTLEARFEDGHSRRLQTVGAGELLGWSWMFSNSFRQLQARALEPTEVIYFYGDRLRHMCDNDHDLGYQLFRGVAEVMMGRLQATRQLLLELPTPAPVLAGSQEWQPGSH